MKIIVNLLELLWKKLFLGMLLSYGNLNIYSWREMYVLVMLLDNVFKFVYYFLYDYENNY